MGFDVWGVGISSWTSSFGQGAGTTLTAFDLLTVPFLRSMPVPLIDEYVRCDERSGMIIQQLVYPTKETHARGNVAEPVALRNFVGLRFLARRQAWLL